MSRSMTMACRWECCRLSCRLLLRDVVSRKVIRHQVKRPGGFPGTFVDVVSAVDLASVPDAHDVNDEYVVENFIEHSVVTHANAIHTVLTCHRDARRRPRILGEQLNSGTDSLLVTALKRGQRLRGASSDTDLVAIAHARPSSALTCSHGT